MLRAVSASGGAPGNFSTLTVTGQGLFSDGNAVSPSISFINDPVSGFYRFGAASMGLTIGGSRWAWGIISLAYRNDYTVGWSPSDPASNAADALFRRDAIGLIGVQNSIAMRGGAGFGMKAIAGSYSVTQDDFTLACSTATQSFTVLLPLNPAMNQYLNIKKVSADANRLTIDGNGNLIDALSTQSTILTTRPSFALHFGSTVASPTGSAWQIL